MTRIKYHDRPRWRETGLLYDGRSLLVALHPTKILLRRKGTRAVVDLPFNVVFLKAAMAQEVLARSSKRKRSATIKRGAIV